jgi:OOP family OmpA-OmpF porin
MFKKSIVLIFAFLTVASASNFASFKYGLTSIDNDGGADFSQHSFEADIKFDNGYNIAPRLGLSYVNIDKRGESVSGLLQLNIEGVYDFISNYELTPYIFGGGGYEHVISSRKNFDSQLFLDLGVGAFYPISNRLNLLGELKSMYMLNGDSDQDAEFAFYIGVSMPLLDSVDANGVDSDGDGVVDNFDRCPMTPYGVQVDNSGCPLSQIVQIDSDNDTVPDNRDRCPNTPIGIGVDENGCPVVKSEELVLEEKPVVLHTKPKPSIADSDADGVKDEIDECPNTPKGFSVNEFGCPIKKNLQIRFKPNSWLIPSQESWKIKEFANFLKKYPNAKVDIVGYTDVSGSRERNLLLSKKRAQSVKDMLIGYGIRADRIRAIGKGDLNPIAPNDTPQGREKNRRIEAVIR